MNTNIVWQDKKVSLTDREQLNDHKSAIVWLTGLSAAGKSTMAVELERVLFDANVKTYVLDGDNIRKGINSDLDFSNESRTENIRRVGEIAKLFMDSGSVVIVSFISPFIEDRNKIRQSVKDEQFVEVFIDCPLSVCEERDPKGLYEKARQGQITDFTGIDSPYEVPEAPEVHIRTDETTVEQGVAQIKEYLKQQKIIS